MNKEAPPKPPLGSRKEPDDRRGTAARLNPPLRRVREVRDESAHAVCFRPHTVVHRAMGDVSLGDSQASGCWESGVGGRAAQGAKGLSVLEKMLCVFVKRRLFFKCLKFIVREL